MHIDATPAIYLSLHFGDRDHCPVRLSWVGISIDVFRLGKLVVDQNYSTHSRKWPSAEIVGLPYYPLDDPYRTPFSNVLSA